MGQLGRPHPTPYEQVAEYAKIDEDLKTAIVKSLDEARQSVSREQDQQAFRKAAEGAGSFGAGGGVAELFSAAVTGSFANASDEAKQLFSDVLRKHGVSGQWEGERYVPQTLDVHSKEAIDSNWSDGISIEHRITTGGTGTFPIRLTTASWLVGDVEPEKGPDYVLEQLEKMLKQETSERLVAKAKMTEALATRDNAMQEVEELRRALQQMEDRFQNLLGPLVAGRKLPAHGGGGGRPFSISCPNGHVLVGVRGKAGARIDRVSLVCVSLNADGSWNGKSSVAGAAGGGGGSEYSRECARGSAVSGIVLETGGEVDAFNLACRRLVAGGVFGGDTNWLAPVGGSGGHLSGPFICPSTTPASGLHGRAGARIDRLGLTCEPSKHRDKIFPARLSKDNK